ncbi:hypothetical protein H9650_14230 [Psychrobacillus sp. Sa2BUA9]|uniref:Uncharacterized protein n=1 Tax=Psychrobacillus faecigallinarum TaxID=2762235 RepID=A0ABR8RC05_9BACI|nr:hypothetical protein [Psychrobacillus faecigallinarum]MBD7945280.1 hypothetical protein [Psychrobacillus faecigallinarum]
MAINLVARMRVDDGLTQPMRRITRQLGETERATTRLSRRMAQNDTQFNRFRRTTTGLVSGISGLTRGFGGLVSKINPLSMAFTGIATAATGAYGAVKIFNATVGEAMKMEQSKVVIGAMFNDKGVSDDYMKMMDKMAIKSPIFNSQDMYDNSKMYVSRTKDVKQLEKMWKVTERLAAANPMQGTEGAVFALNELLSGDTVSMVDRFGLDKNVLSKIKKLSLEKQITEMDKYLERIGFTNELIEKMGNTSLGLWGQVKERSQTILRTMGEPALKAVSKFMNDALTRLSDSDMTKFANWGGKVIERMVSGLSSNATKLYDWFARLMNDPEFQNKSTLTGKINFVVDDIASKLNNWYEGGGKQQIIDFGSNVAQVMVSAMDATDEVFVLGGKLGSSIWSGMIDGVKKSATESPIGKVLSWSYGWTPQEMLKKSYNRMQEAPWYNKSSKKPSSSGPQKSHSGGLDRVPYSGYQATLHLNEKVLTAQQAKEYREGKSGNGGININVQNMNVREESDINKIAMALAKLLESERGQMAT